MKIRITIILLCVAYGLTGRGQTLWYESAADEWMKSLPVANGRLGIMIYGGVDTERLALNESSMWSGGINPDQNKPYGKERLRELRQLFFEGKTDEGNEKAGQELVGNENNFGSHVPFGDIVIRFVYPDSSEAEGYRRSLMLDKAIADVSYKRNHIKYTREYFASHPGNVVVAHYLASKKGALNFDLGLNLLRPDAHIRMDDNSVVVNGRATQPGRTDMGVRFTAAVKVITKDGTVTHDDKTLQVRNANDVVLIANLTTDYRNPDYIKVCEQAIEKAAGEAYTQLLKEHVTDYSPLFKRVSLQLGTDQTKDRIATDKRWLEMKNGGDDPALQALFFQYGRYLTIISSREDSPLPIALQGFFNDNLACNMGWNNDYHLDINTEQNYWLTNIGNLAECNAPLFRYIADMAKAGKETARVVYGCKGWTAHCTSNIWGFTAPAGCIAWGLFPTGGSWMASHLWTHYEFTHDENYLRQTAYPLLKSNAEFLLDYLCKDPHSGYLVTGPSISPENSFGWNEKRLCASMMPTVDLVLTREILNACLQSTKILGIDTDFGAKVKVALEKLPPIRTNKYGGIREWMEDYDDVNVSHRHTSHLLCLYPYCQISAHRTPELAQAAYNSIERRLKADGWEDVEWSRAWAICNFARLHHSKEAYQSINQLIGKLSRENLFTVSPKGIAGAPWDIFAIDGNTAGAAGIAEMLLQSHEGYVEFLPTLPHEWKDGSFHGLCVRGAAQASATWQDGQVQKAILKATHQGAFAVLLPEGTTAKTKGKKLTPDDEGVVKVQLAEGESLEISK